MDEEEHLDTGDGVRKAGKILGALFIAMALLVSTHLGEFWPFSIYPMFSRAGKPWSRAIVRDISNEPESTIWRSTLLEDIPGDSFALRDHGIEGPDVANFVVKNRNWSAEGQEAFRKIFLDFLSDRALMLYRVDGRAEGERVTVRATPVLFMTSDTTMVNPTLSLD